MRAGGLPAAVRRHPYGAYLLLACLISWSYWIPLAMTGGHRSHFPGLLGPALAALTVTAIVGGRTGLSDLARRMARWRVPLRWYAASLVPLAAAAVAIVVLRLTGHPLPAAAQLRDMPGLPTVGWLGLVVLVLVINGYGEEVGWRGFAWPRLRQRHSIAAAAAIITVPWAIWHAPLFWLDTGLRGMPWWLTPGFLIGLAAGAVVLGWLYESSGASIPVVALFHTTLNLASATTGTADVAAAASATIIAWAILILRHTTTRRPEPPGRQPTDSGVADRSTSNIAAIADRDADSDLDAFATSAGDEPQGHSPRLPW
jgi:membrane protease YdiL (CAAX protease family)